ncbi:hypothetical protein OIU76_016652 [Salix suchowensis]|nr:hypothetical protein OIU76_016652 [Salix suchowensis]
MVAQMVESDVKYITGKHPHARAQYQDLSIVSEPADRPDAFAFINAIESVPITGLFGSGTMVGFADQNFDAVSANLETMYRLNVAGKYISPTKDSGNLTITWYNDAPYLFGAATGVNLQADESFEVQYGELTESVAPPDVYRTARGMGYHKDLNLAFNLTWLFQADANFMYVVRLHFCEFHLTKVNQKVFNIDINNQTAQVGPNAADIIGWTGEMGVPTYNLDYAVFVKDRPGDEEIRVDLHPATCSKPEFYDASINGIEIFKMSGTAGGVGFFFIAAACITAYRRKKIIPVYDSHTSSWLPVHGNCHTDSKPSISGKSTQSSHLSSVAQGLSRHFTLPEILRATKNFDDSNVTAVGGFGKVYKGVIDQTTKKWPSKDQIHNQNRELMSS